MRPSPQHAGGLPASGVTGLQVARSFSGDFLEFVSNAAIEYRFARDNNNRLREFARGTRDSARERDHVGQAGRDSLLAARVRPVYLNHARTVTGAGEHQYARTDCDMASVECTADSAKVYAFAEVAQIIGKCPKMPMHVPS